MLKAGSIYFAIFISLIVTILLGSIMLLTGNSIHFEDMQIQRDQIDANVNSGLIIALEDTSLLKFGEERKLKLYDLEDESDKVILRKSIWGIYGLIYSSESWNNYDARRIILYGTDPHSGEPIALYMADRGGYLSVSSLTSITGLCYLPKLGIRTENINMQNNTSDSVIKGEIKVSNPSLPSLNQQIIEANSLYFKDTLLLSDSIVPFESLARDDSIVQSFRNKSLLLVSNNAIMLNNITLKGNIRIVSSKAIYVAENVNAENIILYAPSVFFNMNFCGCLQAFAQDTIVAGEGCKFQYPSCLGIINHNMNGTYLKVMKNSIVTGCVFIYQQYNATNAPMLEFDNGVVIQGPVYCPGKVQMDGRIDGSLYCQRFVMKTSNAYYEDFLLNAVIDHSRQSKYYAGGLLITGYSKGKEIEWLN